MPVRKILEDGPAKVYVWTDEVEPAALEQLSRAARLPFVHHHVAAMADVHVGIGATVGSVIATHGAIVPAAVGVDIGCGMTAQRLDLRAEDLPDGLEKLRHAIERAVPHGRTDHGGRNDRGAWGETPEALLQAWPHRSLEALLPHVLERHPKLVGGHTNTHRHLGTLGTGNHFIELCLDESGGVWLMLHSGSRGIGNRIGSYFIERAKERLTERGVTLEDADLAWFEQGEPLFEDYLAAVSWAQDFARWNREIMLQNCIAAVGAALRRPMAGHDRAIACHHNYVARETHYGAEVWVTRKGAIRAGAGEMGIIPGSMGARSYLVRGKGCAESFDSCSHGAGRRMSRTEARKRFKTADLVAQTTGIECRKDDGVLDEIPGAYKSIDSVMANQTDLVEVVHELRQILNVKG
jgi:tRNA-splicing ligase RtcB